MPCNMYCVNFGQDDWPGPPARMEASEGCLFQQQSVAVEGALGTACMLQVPGVVVS